MRAGKDPIIGFQNAIKASLVVSLREGYTKDDLDSAVTTTIKVISFAILTSKKMLVRDAPSSFSPEKSQQVNIFHKENDKWYIIGKGIISSSKDSECTDKKISEKNKERRESVEQSESDDKKKDEESEKIKVGNKNKVSQVNVETRSSEHKSDNDFDKEVDDIKDPFEEYNKLSIVSK